MVTPTHYSIWHDVMYDHYYNRVVSGYTDHTHHTSLLSLFCQLIPIPVAMVTDQSPRQQSK